MARKDIDVLKDVNGGTGCVDRLKYHGCMASRMSETLTVTQLNTRVKEIFGSDPGLHDIWVNGEISNLTKASSGHYYFTLKDATSEIRCAMFAGSRRRIDFEPTANMKVSVFGRLDMYVPRGSYQFIVDTMRRSGIGDLYLAYEQLKRRLEAEGLFDKGRKRPLPPYPRRIGVVTSPTGAVIHDIIMTSASRFPADILLAPALVQGEGAAQSIVAGIELLNGQDVDVIIVGRGGGSIEDLWAFNEEPVARAIAASRVPVVSAVGHETDFTIADFVADVRAPTPTGAAAIILRDRVEVLKQIEGDMARANRAVTNRLKGMRSSFEVLDAKLSPKRAEESFGMRCMHLDELSARCDSALRGTVEGMRHRFEVLDSRLSPEKALSDIGVLRTRVDNDLERISTSASHRLEVSASRIDSIGRRPETAIRRLHDNLGSGIESMGKRLEGLNPLNVLGRGYTMVTSENGDVLTSVSRISPGDIIRISMRDGSASAEIREKEMKE